MSTFITSPRTKTALTQIFGSDAYAPSMLEWAVGRTELTFLGTRVMHLLASETDVVVASIPITGVTISIAHVELVGYRAIEIAGAPVDSLLLKQRLFIETVPKAARIHFEGRFPSVLTALPLDSIYTLITFPVDADQPLPITPAEASNN